MMDPRTSAQDVMRCDLCETAVVQMHCDTCLVNLCKACVGEHISSDLSKPHKIFDFKDRKSTPIYPVCTFHDKGRCKMYCKQCNNPICIKCIASDKHLGHKLSEILEVLDERKEKLSKDETELNEVIYPTYQGIASEVQNRTSQLEKEYGDLLTAITKHGEDWHREIDKLVKKLKSEVDEIKNTQLRTLQKNLDEINKKIIEIKDEIDSIEKAVTFHDISKLFRSFNADKYSQLPYKTVLSSPTFIQRRINREQLSKLFGDLSLTPPSIERNVYSMKTPQKSQEARSSPPVKQLIDEPETVTNIDTEYGNLYNVTCLSCEEIWTSGSDRTMKLYSINQGLLLKSITTKSGYSPDDIAVTKSGDLGYTDTSGRTVNIVKNEKIEEVIRLQNWRPQGVCSTSSGDLLVIMDSDDYTQTKVVYCFSSKVKQTIQFDNEGKPLYSNGPYYRYITENRNLDICVSDSDAKAEVVVNQAGKLRFRYTGHNPALKNRPFSPLGITTNSQSHILTADFINHCVHIIDQDGQFLRYIDCGLRAPMGLCTDTNDNLFVAQASGQRNL